MIFLSVFERKLYKKDCAYFKFCCCYSDTLKSLNVGEFPQNLNFWGTSMSATCAKLLFC